MVTATKDHHRPSPSAADFQAWFESAPGLYLVLQPDFTIVGASDAYLRATMTRREEILGRDIFQAFPDNPDDPNATGVRNLRASLMRVRQDKVPDTMAVQKYDIRRPDAEGGGFEERFWSPINSPVLLGESQNLAYIIHRVEDVTEFVRLKEQRAEQARLAEHLQLRVEQMDAEIFQRAQQIQDANQQLRLAYQKLDQLDQLKTQFFANVSHELRTPLALIIGFTDKLLRASHINHDHSDLRAIARNAHLLLGHVEDLLDISKLEAGEMVVQYTRFDMGALVRLLADQFEVLANERGVRYILECPKALPVEMDPHKFRRVLLNLLSNAFKFTPSGGVVRCTLRMASEEGHALLEVADSGPGIPADKRLLVFERFRQLDAGDDRRFGGTGLGLAIARDFVTLHRGSIDIETAAEGGACFVVRLPVNAPAGSTIRVPASVTDLMRAEDLSLDSFLSVPEEPSPFALGANDHRPIVLVVEDNREMNRFICQNLAEEFRTVTAFDGREGLSKAVETKPDLILSDVMMPSVTGDSLVLAIRSRADLHHTPIILLSAKADDDVKVRLLQQGAQDYITKPFSIAELRARVRNLIAAERARQIVKREREWARALMDSAPDAIVISNEAGKIVLVNGRAVALLGYTRHELVGQSVDILLPERFRSRPVPHRRHHLRALMVRLMAGNMELYVRRSDGGELPVEIRLSPVRTANGPQIACAIRDVSERKRVLEELQEARQQADRANRAKSAFLATASHDLRQPAYTLALLNGVLQRMVKDPAAIDTLKQQATAISGMTRLLNRLLDIAKLESGASKPEITVWNIQSLFADLRIEFAEPARSKGLELSVVAGTALVRSDVSLIGQVLRNLVSNAIKYTHSGGVHLLADAQGVVVRVAVHDSGIGMAPEELAHIYDEFYQVAVPGQTAKEGYGLGLSIVSRIVKLLDLKLLVRSEPGKGSVFSLELPRA